MGFENDCLYAGLNSWLSALALPSWLSSVLLSNQAKKSRLALRKCHWNFGRVEVQWAFKFLKTNVNSVRTDCTFVGRRFPDFEVYKTSLKEVSFFSKSWTNSCFFLKRSTNTYCLYFFQNVREQLSFFKKNISTNSWLYSQM